jgi:hypothetical protein
LKLHCALITKQRLIQLGWEIVLQHQDGQAEQTHWSLTSNIPYQTRTLIPKDPKRKTWWGVEYKEWKVTFNRKNDLVKFLQRYYKHHVNFWDWEQLEDGIQYEDTHIYKVLHSPQPYRNRRGW